MFSFPITDHVMFSREFAFSLFINNNVLSSRGFSMGISFVVKDAGAIMLLFPLEYKTSVIINNLNTQNVKIARRDRPHILASHRCKAFENLLPIDIAPVRRSLSGILLSKKGR